MEEQQAAFNESHTYSAGYEAVDRDNDSSPIEHEQKLSPQEGMMNAPMTNQSSSGWLRRGKGVALAGLILAVAALVILLLTPLIGLPALLVALICAFASLVLSALGYRSPSARTIARVGLVLSLIENVLVVLLLLVLTPVSRHVQPP